MHLKVGSFVSTIHLVAITVTFGATCFTICANRLGTPPHWHVGYYYLSLVTILNRTWMFGPMRAIVAFLSGRYGTIKAIHWDTGTRRD
jgi:hypothetical protein